MAMCPFSGPGDYILRDWVKLDVVLREMIPMGFGSAECAEATGVPRDQLIMRSHRLGMPFSEAWGPESKCRAGHKLQELGYIETTSLVTGRVGRACKTCRDVSYERRDIARRKKNGYKKRGPRKKAKPKKESTTHRAYEAAMLTNSIVALHEQMEREPMWWDREKIQAKIDEMALRITA